MMAGPIGGRFTLCGKRLVPICTDLPELHSASITLIRILLGQLDGPPQGGKTMRSYRTWLRPILVGMALCGGAASAAHAAPSPAPFTWDPAAAGLTGSAFTADTIYVTGYVRDDGTTANRIEIINGFSLNGGATFTPAGLGSTYGLYFQTIDQGIHGAPPNILTFTSVALKLKADPGNHNGAVISTPTAFHFTNTGLTGEADDILLAGGALVKGGVVVDLTAGIVTGDQIDTFIPGLAWIFSGWIGVGEGLRLESPLASDHDDLIRWHDNYQLQRHRRNLPVRARTGLDRPAWNGPSRPSDTLPAIPPKAVNTLT